MTRTVFTEPRPMTHKPSAVTAKTPDMSPLMRDALEWFAEVDFGHRGDTPWNTANALIKRGFLAFNCWGMDETHGRGEVPMYSITDAGKATLRDAAKGRRA